jgi:hypothetical protein
VPVAAPTCGWPPVADRRSWSATQRATTRRSSISSRGRFAAEDEEPTDDLELRAVAQDRERGAPAQLLDREAAPQRA